MLNLLEGALAVALISASLRFESGASLRGSQSTVPMVATAWKAAGERRTTNFDQDALAGFT